MVVGLHHSRQSKPSIVLNPLPAFLLGLVAVQSFHPTAVSFPKPLKVTVAVSDSNFRYGGFLCESMGNQAGKCGQTSCRVDGL